MTWLTGLTIGAAILLAATAVRADRLDPWESRLITIGPYEFDTRSGEPMIPEHLRSSSGEMWLIQLAAPVCENAKDVLRGLGVEFYEYIPNNGFLCRVPPGREALVASSSALLWMGRFHPAYKTSSRLHGAAGRVEVSVLGFPWVDGERFVEQLRRGGVDVADWYADPLNVTAYGAVSADRLQDIVALDDVYSVEPWFRVLLHNHRAQWVMQTNQNSNRRLWDLGLDGTGRVISTSDSGILTTHQMFYDPAVAIPDSGDYPTHRKIIAYKLHPNAVFGDNAAHMWHGTHTGGTACGNDENGAPYDGVARECKNFFIDIGDASGSLVNCNVWWIATQAYTGNAAGHAFVQSWSWGSDTEGQYTGRDRSADNWIWSHRDGALFKSAGNKEPGVVYTGSPGNAKSVVTVGGTWNGQQADVIWPWSCEGPTADGRIKPDVLAPASIYSSIGPGSADYATADGTSMASPAAASSATMVTQYLEEGWYPSGAPALRDAIHPSAALIKAIMVNGGDENITSYTVPSFRIGWGRACLDSVLYFAGDTLGLEVVDDTLGITTGTVRSYQYEVQACRKLEVTLVWSDDKGSITTPATTPKIVNDLDLEVQAPGCLYKGNVYSGGQSQAGGSYDRLNTVECVHLYNVCAGTYTVRVTAHDVPSGPQPFALVVTGYFATGDVEPPTAPPWVTLTKTGTLTWGASTDNVGVDHYCVYRQPKAYFSTQGVAALATTSGTTWNFPGSMGNPATNYFFIVRAYDAANNESPPSPTAGEFDYDTTN